MFYFQLYFHRSFCIRYILIADTDTVYLVENIVCAVLNSGLCPHITMLSFQFCPYSIL
jgi:hypothetical protein